MPLLTRDIYDTESDPLYGARGVLWGCVLGLALGALVVAVVVRAIR